jgi:Ca-activated chloride channel family protein
MLYLSGFLFSSVLALTSLLVLPDSRSGPGQGQTSQVSITPRKALRSSKRRESNLRLDVKQVLIPVTVTDAWDRPVTTLSKDSFRVLEDGVEQPINSFSQEEAPVSLGLLFDSSGSMKDRIASSVEALRLLFQTTLQGDEFFVVQFSDQARLLGGFTKDPEEIHRRLGLVQARGWTALLDAVALGAHQMRSAANGRRVLLVLSDGNDNNSRFSEAEIRTMVVESDVRVYGIGLLHRPRLLQQLAEQTGGKVLIAQSLSELPDVVERLSREIRSQYILGYSSPNPLNDGKYRKVKIELAPPPGLPALRASWRRGYYAPAE